MIDNKTQAGDVEASDVEASNHDQQYECGNYKKVFLGLSDFIVGLLHKIQINKQFRIECYFYIFKDSTSIKAGSPL